MSTWDPTSITHTAPLHSSSALTAEPEGPLIHLLVPSSWHRAADVSMLLAEADAQPALGERPRLTVLDTGAMTQPHPQAQPGHTVGPRGAQHLKPSGRFLISKLGLRSAVRVLFIS